MIDEEKEEKKRKGKRERRRFKGLGRRWALGCCGLSASKQTNKLRKTLIGLGLV